MKYYAHSVFTHIRDQVGRSNTGPAADRLLFMLPDAPPPVVLEIGKLLIDYARETGAADDVSVKVARIVYESWPQDGDPGWSAAVEEMENRGWIAQSDNLTSYRNERRASGGKRTLLLLVGADRVMDAASLADFHDCGPVTIWRSVMNKRFHSWAEQCLRDSQVDFDDTTLDRFHIVLDALRERGLADLFRISTILEDLPLQRAQTGDDAVELLLDHVTTVFTLPRFASFDEWDKPKAFGALLDTAQAFFSYDAYLEERARKNTLRKVEAFLEHRRTDPDASDNFTEEELGSFSSEEDLAKAVLTYVSARDEEARTKLLECDFPAVNKKLLNFRRRKEKTAPRPTRLTGLPCEVVLTALWFSFQDFRRLLKQSEASLDEVRIEGLDYRYDVDGADENDRKEHALAYLRRLVGGVDEFIRENLSLPSGVSDGNPGDEEVRVICSLAPEDISLRSAGRGEPFLEFQVVISWAAVNGDKDSVQHVFRWRLPEVHPYRIADELLCWAERQISDLRPPVCVPVFLLEHFDELMHATGEEELYRVLQYSLRHENSRIENLLPSKSIPEDRFPNKFRGALSQLGAAYARFLQEAARKGLYAALLNQNLWTSLRDAYIETSRLILSDPACGERDFAALLFRAFLGVRRPATSDTGWQWRPYEESACVTVLHPALLEMLQAQSQYLAACFNAAFRREWRKPYRQAFRPSAWWGMVDLARVRFPLCGLLKDRNGNLDTTVFGDGLLHRIGKAGTKNKISSLSTRILLEYENVEDDDISESELFRESRESRLLEAVFRDYVTLYPHALDGLSIVILHEGDVQPFVAGIDAFLRWLFKERLGDEGRYALTATFFSSAEDESGVHRWIQQWKNRADEEDDSEKWRHYRRTRLRVSHRILDPINIPESFRDQVQEIEADIAVLNHFIADLSQEAGNAFLAVGPYDVRRRTLKFPILEKPACAMRNYGGELERARVLSNRQFLISTKHTEVMAHLRNSGYMTGENHIVLAVGDYRPWQKAVDVLHERVGWVVCIDPCVDENLLRKKSSSGPGIPLREIIGFGSGVGAHGEANYTISTEQFRLSDIEIRLKDSIRSVFPDWSGETCEQAAKEIIREASHFSGISIVRATGVGTHIRDYMAYALTRKLLLSAAGQDDAIMSHLFSLDAYQHWFDSGDMQNRPDLLWLTARVDEEGYLHLDARIIECKTAQRSDQTIDKAFEQVEAGLKHLTRCFEPRDEASLIEDERPDQRYWWLQLYRLIASVASIRQKDQATILHALERLSDGAFSIEWRGLVLAFWTNDSSSEWRIERERTVLLPGDQEIVIPALGCGAEFVCQLALGGNVDYTVPWGSAVVWAARQKEEDESSPPPFSRDGSDEGSEDTQETPDDEGRLIEPSPSPDTGGGSGEEGEEAQHTPVLPSSRVMTPKIPERIFLGYTVRSNRPVFWEFGHPDLGNRHILIFGTSGMGKTYTIQCLLTELARAGQHSIIVDYTNGFTSEQIEPKAREFLNPRQHIVARNPLPINPFRRMLQEIEGETILESSSTAAQRIAGVFAEVYKIGDQQKSVLYQAIRAGIEGTGEFEITLDDLERCLLDLMKTQSKPASDAAASLLNKLRPFLDQHPFGEEKIDSWNDLYNDPKVFCHVIQLAGFSRDVARLITEFCMLDMYRYYREHGRPDKPRVVVLDEIQNLDHRADGPLGQLLTEGRKFGFSLILATQIMSNLDRDQRDRLFNAAHKLFFRPADTEMRTYAEIAAQLTNRPVDQWRKDLAALGKGQCYSLGPSLNMGTGELETKTFLVRIASLEDRLKNG